MSLLKWATLFLFVALVAALFGFTGMAAAAAGIARVLFFFFLVGLLVFLLWAFLTPKSASTSKGSNE